MLKSPAHRRGAAAAGRPPPGTWSGGYHLPSEACHQPGPWEVSLMSISCQWVDRGSLRA